MFDVAARGALVGRAAELDRLLGLLDQAAAGQSAAALVSGDAGVGKTRLISELSTQALDRGFMVLSGRCAELGDSIPYLPLADALRTAIQAPAASAALRDAIAARPVLSRLLPDRGGGDMAGREAEGIAQQQLFGAVIGLLAELAAAAPVMVVLEDLHWADRSTRDLVTFLSRVLHRERVAVVATYRTDDLHRGHPLRAVAAELARLPSATALELGPLDDEAMAEHLRSMTPQPLTALALAAIIRRAEGNAYYAEELLTAAADECELPAGLAELLLARLQRLSANGQRVAHAAAAVGRRVDDDMVRRICGLPDAEYDAAVAEAVARQLLVPDGEQGYMFRHALMREAAYADLLPGERTRLHASLAELLADEQRLAMVPGTAAELAHHCLASHDTEGAFRASVGAGREAERLGAPAEAHRHFEQALSLWDRVGDAGAIAGVDRGRLAFDAATNAAASGNVIRAVHQLRRILELLDRAADPVLLSRVNERLAFYLLEVAQQTEAAERARAAIDMLPEDPPRWERARALATYAQTLLHADDGAAAQSWAQRAQQAARAAGAPWVEADSLVTLGQLQERAGRTDEAVALFTLAHRQASEAGVVSVHLRAAFQLGRILLETGDLARAASAAHEGMQRAEEAGLGLAPYGLDLQFLHYLVHFADGSWDHAQQLADGFPIRVSSGREAVLSAMALFIDVARGNAAVAERQAWLELVWESEKFGEYIGRGLLAEHALWRGDTATALAEVAASARAQIDHLGGYGPPLIRVAAVGLAAQADRAFRARATGDAEAEQAALTGGADLIELAREGAAYRRRPDWELGVEGRAWLARAEAEWGRAQGRNSPQAWQGVVDAFGPAFVYEAARSRWRLAEALLEAGRRDDASQEWRRATEAAERLGARPLSAALAELGRRGRLGPDRPGRRAAGTALTFREQEVLALLAAGRSNREIAATLFIAPKTASVHVSNILAKLGAVSRTEAAAIAHAEGVGLPSRAG